MNEMRNRNATTLAQGYKRSKDQGDPFRVTSFAQGRNRPWPTKVVSRHGETSRLLLDSNVTKEVAGGDLHAIVKRVLDREVHDQRRDYLEGEWRVLWSMYPESTFEVMQ